MKTVEFTVLDARKLLGKSKEVDEFIHEKFTEEDLNLSISDRVKTFEDAYLIATGYSYQEKKDDFERGLRPHELARRKLETICEVLNDGWIPDFLSEDEYKWYPWFFVKNNGDGSAGLSGSHASRSFAVASADFGARLCFEAKEKSEYAGKQFIDLYEIMLLR